MTGPASSSALAAPAALDLFFEFAQLLRASGFSIAPDQTQNFIAGVGLLGPRSMQDIRLAGIATLAPPPDRMDEFDALFRKVFYGQTLAPDIENIGEDDDEVDAFDAADGDMPPPEPDEETESGADATILEKLSTRSFQTHGDDNALRQFRRDAPRALPRRRSLRRTRAKSGDRFDMRRVMRDAAKHDGEVITLPARKRRTKQRRILMLIDISGSMKEQTDAHLKIAHALYHAGEQVEVFTLGTRLTRVSRVLRHRDPDRALALAANLVADWDGGTRLGDALAAFLAVPRFAGFAWGALAVIVSDGLERGGPAALVAATAKLSRLAWQTLWLTPLMQDPDYRPETEALAAVLPFLDRLGSAASTQDICAELLGSHLHRGAA
jgi:uncharacterized protein with von Willebrand factor type A (vWA) domain